MRPTVPLGSILVALGVSLLLPVRAAAHASSDSKAASSRPTTVIVQEGQTLWSIARAYRVSVDAIVRANRLRSADIIAAGQRLVIPGTQRTPTGARLTKAVPSQTSVRRTSSVFRWPARGTLTSRFGWRGRRHHDGIDIAAPRGTSIYAAQAGRVTFSGRYYGYGRTVMVDHGSGATTIYGHASALLVRRGQVVRAGQMIARVGCTGHCSGPHLHFEVRVQDRPVDPLAVLSGRPLRHAAPTKAAGATARVQRKPQQVARSVGQTAEDPEVITRELVTVSEHTVTRITELLRQGVVVQREEEIITALDCGLERIRRKYLLANGALVVVEEERDVQFCDDDDERDD